MIENKFIIQHDISYNRYNVTSILHNNCSEITFSEVLLMDKDISVFHYSDRMAINVFPLYNIFNLYSNKPIVITSLVNLRILLRMSLIDRIML